MINKHLVKDALGWGFVQWLIGYILGVMLFFVVPPAYIGYIIMPIGLFLSLGILFIKIKEKKFQHYIIIAIAWTLIAIIFDYIFIVLVFKSKNYYKMDVYIYYLLTFVLPVIAGYFKSRK